MQPTILHHASPTTTPYRASPTTTPYRASPTTTPYRASPTTTPYRASPTTTPYRASPTTTPQDTSFYYNSFSESLRILSPITHNHSSLLSNQSSPIISSNFQQATSTSELNDTMGSILSSLQMVASALNMMAKGQQDIIAKVH